MLDALKIGTVRGRLGAAALALALASSMVRRCPRRPCRGNQRPTTGSAKPWCPRRRDFDSQRRAEGIAGPGPPEVYHVTQ